jgi:hypothetical protein
MTKIKWIKSGLEIVGVGKSDFGREVNVTKEIADSLILQGIAKLSKPSKIKSNDKKGSK